MYLVPSSSFGSVGLWDICKIAGTISKVPAFDTFKLSVTC